MNKLILLLALILAGSLAALKVAALMPAPAQTGLHLADGPPTPDPRPPQKPLPPGTRADRILIEKSVRRLTLYDGARKIRSYDVALGTGGLARKRQEFDNLTPEGRYTVSHQPQSRYHYALRISYPSPRDIADAKARGVSPGGDIMIHGLPPAFSWLGSRHTQTDWTAGCIAVTDAEIDEIAGTVKNGTVVEIVP